jgi:hypothetical protein
MLTAKERLFNIIADIPESEANEIIEFIEHLNQRSGIDANKEMAELSDFKFEYWASDISDEVWK